jgi:hypothetical protein
MPGRAPLGRRRFESTVPRYSRAGRPVCQLHDIAAAQDDFRQSPPAVRDPRGRVAHLAA